MVKMIIYEKIESDNRNKNRVLHVRNIQWLKKHHAGFTMPSKIIFIL